MLQYRVTPGASSPVYSDAVNTTDDFCWTPWKKVATDIDDNYTKNMGKLSSNTDLNTLTDNAMYLLVTNYSYVYRPWETLAGFLMIKTVENVTLQTAESLNGTRKSRSSADGGSTWTEWV